MSKFLVTVGLVFGSAFSAFASQNASMIYCNALKTEAFGQLLETTIFHGASEVKGALLRGNFEKIKVASAGKFYVYTANRKTRVDLPNSTYRQTDESLTLRLNLANPAHSMYIIHTGEKTCDKTECRASGSAYASGEIACNMARIL